MPELNQTIPDIFHFIWIGKNIENNKESLKLWRSYHPNHIINLWTTPETLLNKSFIKFLNEQYIDLRNIKQETELENYDYILQEINRGNPWSASDTLRISILLKEPGFYFDINVTPKQTFPSRIISKDGALFCLDTKNTFQRNDLVISYKILATSFPNHQILKKVCKVIRSNFDYLNQEVKLQESFFKLPYPEDEKNYIFAVFVIGRAIPYILYNQYTTPPFLSENRALDLNEVRQLIFPYKYILNIPTVKGEKINIKKYSSFERLITAHVAFITGQKEIENPTLADRLNSVASPLQFVTYLNGEGKTFALAKIESVGQEKIAADLAKQLNKVKCINGDIFLGKNRFFTIPNLNEEEVGEKVQTMLKNNNK